MVVFLKVGTCVSIYETPRGSNSKMSVVPYGIRNMQNTSANAPKGTPGATCFTHNPQKGLRPRGQRTEMVLKVKKRCAIKGTWYSKQCIHISGIDSR
jgi:hypothetical protein